MAPASAQHGDVALLQVNGGTVELAGVCAEGDNCQRYHCTACGEYWLNDPAHACRDGRPSRYDLERTIANWMDSQLKRGDDLVTSAAKVLKRVKQAGLSEALLDAFGEQLIADLWRRRQSEQPQPVGRAIVSPANVRTPVHHEATPAKAYANGVQRGGPRGPSNSARGTRRIDIDQLKSNEALLETLLQVDGQWVRLGDLDKHQCEALQRKYEREMGVARARALAFGRLAAELDEGQMVRERWTVEQLEALVGDTLNDAAPALPEQI